MSIPTPPISLAVPVQLPAPDDMREIIADAARSTAAQLLTWMKYDEAAAHLRCTKRTVERMLTTYGIPVSELGGLRLISRADLDALVVSHLTAPPCSVLVVWPSTMALPHEARAVAWPSRKLAAELQSLRADAPAGEQQQQAA